MTFLLGPVSTICILYFPVLHYSQWGCGLLNVTWKNNIKIRSSMRPWHPTHQLRAAGTISNIKSKHRWDSNQVWVPHTPASFIVCQALVPEMCKHLSDSKCVGSPLLWIWLLILWSTFLNWSFSIELNSREKKLLRSIEKGLIQTSCKMWASLNQRHYSSEKIYSRLGKAHLLLNSFLYCKLREIK